MVKESDYLDLVADAQAGSRDSMNRLAVCIRQRLYPYLFRVTSDRDVSEDLLQEVLLATVRHLGRLEQLESFWPWMYAIARCKIKNHFRNQYRRRSLQSTGFARVYCYQRRQDSRDEWDIAVHRERREAVSAALVYLEKQYRDVVRLRCFEEMSFSEIASVTGCSCQQVRTRFFRAKRSLRARLSAAGSLQE